MLKMRTRAESKSNPKLPLVWDDNEETTEQDAQEQQPQSSPAFDLADQDEVQEPAPAPSQEAPAENEQASDLPEENMENQLSQDRNIVVKLHASNSVEDKPEQAPERIVPEETHPQDQEKPVATEDAPQILELDDNEKLGFTLTRLRAKTGATIQEVADKTKIPPLKIKALEQGNYEALPKLPFCKGYIEKLCNEYDVSPESLLLKLEAEYIQAIGMDNSDPMLVQTPLEHHKRKSSNLSLPGLLIAGLLAILCLFIVGGIMKLYFRKEVERPKVDLTQKIEVKPQPAPPLEIPENP